MASDTFWEYAPSAVACYVLRGPGRLLDPSLGYGDRRVQWLVRVEPPVTDDGVTTTHVIVFADQLSWRRGEDWGIGGEGAYSLRPSVSVDKPLFGAEDLLASHKIMVTTRPDWPYGWPPLDG